jgi:hypothetical protein
MRRGLGWSLRMYSSLWAAHHEYSIGLPFLPMLGGATGFPQTTADEQHP